LRARKIRTALAVALAFGGGVAIAVQASASAASCTTIVHNDLKNVITTNDGTQTNATAELLDDGVKISTPDAQSWVYTPFTDSSTLSNVTPGSYRTFKYDTTGGIVLPTYKIEVYLSGLATPAAGWVGSNYTTLNYEPYQDKGNGAVKTNTWQTWDTFEGGDAKWWSSHPLTAIAGDQGQATPQKWSAIVSAYPDAKVISYEIGQGTHNDGAVTAFNDLTYTGDKGCVTQNWAKAKAASPSPSASSPDGVPPAPVPTPVRGNLPVTG
jgi:hypothetical protein